MPIMLNKTATQSSVAQPQTNTGTQGNTQQTQQPSPTYTFNGQTYATREAADEARNKYIADRKMKVMSVFADAASVGFDEDQFKALMQSGSGLSQMSDAERSYISSRYQATNPYDRKAYTDSAVDQYLASVGLPSSKELNNYRKAYYEYASSGGVAENYSNLDDDTFRYIQKHWKDGMQTGIDGKLYTSKGKEVEYKDTLLDEQLQSLGLPPSSMMNDYFLDYQQDKQIDAEIDDFYAAVYEKSNKGMSSEEAYRTTLADPKYLHLSEYVSEAVAYPNEADYTDDDVLSDTYGQTDSAKYDAAWGKALTADAKRDSMEHRISYKDYEGYATKRMQQARWEAQTEKYKTYQENGRKWMTTPATTDDEKKQRSTEMTQFLAVYGNGTTLSDMGTYFSLLDAGVPYETISWGYAAISAWNETNNRDADTYADVKLLSQGYSTDDGDYETNKNIVNQTRLYSSRADYEQFRGFDVSVYNQRVDSDGRVSPAGAIYAAVNGVESAPVNSSESSDLLYMLYVPENSFGKNLCDYMTVEEKGVFNYLFCKNAVSGLAYLSGLSGMLEDRKYAGYAFEDFDGKVQQWQKDIEAGKEAQEANKTNPLSPRDSVGKMKRSEAIRKAENARREMAAMYSELNLRSVAENVPQENRRYYLMTEDQFNAFYSEAEDNYKKALQEADDYEDDHDSSSPNAAHMAHVQAEAMRDKAAKTFAPIEQAKRYRVAVGAEAAYAELFSIPDEDKTIYAYPDTANKRAAGKSFEDMTAFVSWNQNNWNTVPWANNSEWDGSNWKEAYNRKWDATDYDKTHDTKGSRYAALVNEWSYINGRTALLYTQQFQLTSDIANIGEFLGTIFGGDINRDHAYKVFRNSCVMAFNRDWETSGTDEQKEQMDAMLTLANLMTDEERARFNAILDEAGAASADRYFTYLYENVLPTRFRQYVDDEMAFDTRDVTIKGIPDATNKIKHSLMSIPVNLVQGVSGPVHTLSTDQDDPVAAQLGAAKYSTAQSMRNSIASQFSETGQFFYQTGMSMADSATVAVISSGIGNVLEGAGVATKVASKVGSVLGGSLLGGSAFNSSYDEALQRGLSPDDARATALGNGINEMLFESVSLDLLVSRFKTGDMLKVSRSSFVNWAVNTLVEAGVEGSEEVFTDMANKLWDNGINGIFSEELQQLRWYMAEEGLSYEEAKNKVNTDFAKQLGLSFAGGFISGGVMGGFSSIPGAIRNSGGQDENNSAAPVRKHTDTYTAGRSVVDRMFGKSVGDNVQLALENRESESDAQRIDAISNALLNLDNSSYLYGYTHDADGNLTLSDDERVALASVLAMAYDDANADNLDAAFIHAMSQMQTDQQRAANTNYDGIKTAQEIRNINEQIAKTQESINTIETEQQVKLSDAQSTYSAAASEVHAITKKVAAVTSAKEKKSLQASLKVAQDKRDNIKARLKTVETTDAANAQARIKAAKEEIARQRSLLDRHYASASAFLNEYAPTSFSGATAARAASNARASEVGAKIDAIVSSDMSESEKESALAPLREQLASAVGNVRSIENRLNNADPAALTNAMNAMKSGTVSDFIRSQQENAQNAANTAQNAETENTSNAEQNGEDAASNGVKQGDAKQNTEKKTEHVIGARVQQQFNRIARKFGCEITWGDDNTVIGDSGLTLKGRNGAYNRSEPNKIYLNTRMFTKNAISSEQAVAREFFTHEIVHYVANTKTYRSLMARAAAYYNTAYKDNGGTDTIVNGIMADEQMHGNTGFTRSQALEEMTAVFAQEVLFAKTNGDRRALVWLARSDRGIVSNFLTTVEYLIKRGNVRRSKDGGAVKAMLLDAEYELIQALRERQYLDAHGKRNAFERRSTRTSAESLDGAEAGSEAESSTARSRHDVNAEAETLSDVRAIFTGKSEGRGDVRSSRGMTADEYMALDFSKNKLLQKDGTPYDELYSGTPYAGFTIFDPAYADDGLSNFATSSRRIAQSYTWAGEKAGEYDPRNADRHRNQTGAKGEYLQVNEYGQYRRHDDAQLLNMLNQQSGYAFDVVNMQEADLELRSIKKGPVKADAAEGMNIAKLIYYAASHVATNHTAADFEELQDAYGALKIMNERLAPAARAELERVRGRISDADYKVGAETPENTPLLAVTSYLRALQTGVEDTLINSGIYDTLQSADEHMSQYWDMETGELLQANVPEDLFVGFDSKYKGKAQLYDRWETETRLPTYSGGENGVYKLKLYAEHPLSIDVQDQNWDSIDVNSFPADVREKLAQLYGYKLSYITREVSRAAYEAGYDAVQFRGLHDTGSFYMDEASDVIITFKPYQSKSVYNENPTTNPDIMFSTGMTIDDYTNRYGQKEQNIFGQQNNIRTPNNVDNDAGRVFRVSDSAQTLKEVAHIRQSARDVIDEGILQQADGLIERHGLVYETITLDRMRELGTRYIAEHGGLTQSMRDLTRDMPRASQGQLVEYMSAANQVFTEIGAEGTFDPREYYEFVASYVEMRSTWGRVGRAMQLVNDSPLGRVAYWQRVITRINEKNNEAVRRGLNPLFYRNGAPVIDVPQSFFDVLAQARTQEEIDAAELAITRYIGQNSPLTVSDALRNWRYFSMLANPVTHARNMLGNVTMLGGRTVKDTIAAGMENVAVRMGLMDADERTHAVVLSQDADTRAYVRQLWDENADAVQSGGRDGFKQQLSDAVRKSPIRALDAAMRFNGNALETEDRLFLYSTFTAAASQYIKAQNIDVNHVTREQQGAIVNYATQQAQEATYRDASKLADALNQFAKSGWVQQLIVDAVMPFKKTPINIAKRGIEYSPAGFAKGLYHIAQNAVAQHRGEQAHVRASVIVDELAKGVTGSMLSLIGFFLAKAGILKVSAGDGDKDSAFERDVGHQDYSLEIGDLSIKIEALAPLTFPLFMGAQLQRLTSKEHDGLSMSDLTDAAMTLADPLMDMSFMSSLNSVLETYDNNKLSGVAVNAMQAYLGQYLPTLGSKLNQTINPTRRTAKASQASPLGTTWDYWLRSMAAKIPGVNQAVLEPYVKTTGEYDKKTSFGDYALAFINNFVSPVNVQIMDTTPVNTELARIVSVTGATDFVPQNPKKYLTIGGERYNMTAKEYTQYSKEHNETVYAVLSQVIQSDAYARATDDQRAEMLKKAYDRAHKTIMDKYKAIFAQK